MAGDVRSVAEELPNQGKQRPAELAERAAERAERLGGYLHRSDGERILGDVEDFARSRPWAVAAGGLALGFAASRFLKASSGRRYQASRGGSAPASAQVRSARLDEGEGVAIPPTRGVEGMGARPPVAGAGS